MYKKILVTALSSIIYHSGIAQTTSPGNYCDASFDDAQGFLVDDHISKVKFGTLENNSLSQFAAPHYVFYDNLPVAKYNVNETYDLNLSFEVRGGCGYGVWIDYNQNNIFEPSEKVAGTTGTEMLDLGSNITVAKSILIPEHAKAGITRMRIRIVEDDLFNMNSTDIEPCNLSNSNQDVMDWGETEDYAIEMVASTPNSIELKNNANHIALFPNPNNGQFSLQSSHKISGIQIFNSLGQVVYHKAANNTMSEQIAVSFSSGMYWVKVDTKEGVSYKQFIVQ